jgi:hypothetical protein
VIVGSSAYAALTPAVAEERSPDSSIVASAPAPAAIVNWVTTDPTSRNCGVSR